MSVLNKLWKDTILVLVSWTLIVLVSYFCVESYVLQSLQKIDYKIFINAKDRVEKEINGDFEKLELFLRLNKELLHSEDEHKLNARLRNFINAGEFRYLRNLQFKLAAQNISGEGLNPFTLIAEHELEDNSSKVYLYLDKTELRNTINSLVVGSASDIRVNDRELENNYISSALAFKWFLHDEYELSFSESSHSALFKKYLEILVVSTYIFGIGMMCLYKRVILTKYLSAYKNGFIQLTKKVEELTEQKKRLLREITILSKSPTVKMVENRFYEQFRLASERLYCLIRALAGNNDTNVASIITEAKREEISKEIEQQAFLLSNKIIYNNNAEVIEVGEMLNEALDFLHSRAVKKKIALKADIKMEVNVGIGETALKQIVISMIRFQMNCLGEGKFIEVQIEDKGKTLCINSSDNGFGLDLENLQKFEKLNDDDLHFYILNWEGITRSVKSHGLEVSYSSFNERGGQFTLLIPKVGIVEHKTSVKNVVSLFKKHVVH